MKNLTTIVVCMFITMILFGSCESKKSKESSTTTSKKIVRSKKTDSTSPPTSPPNTATIDPAKFNELIDKMNDLEEKLEEPKCTCTLTESRVREIVDSMICAFAHKNL